MPSKPKAAAAGGGWGSSTMGILSDWVRQGTESFFATQRILLDLVVQQNTNTLQLVRDRLAGAGSAPVTALTEMAGEGISNFIAAQRVLLQLAERQNEIVMGAVSERATGPAPVAAMAELLRRLAFLLRRPGAHGNYLIRVFHRLAAFDFIDIFHPLDNAAPDCIFSIQEMSVVEANEELTVCAIGMIRTGH